MSDSVFETKTNGIIAGMTDNANFPAPPVPIADLIKARDVYSAALVGAKEGGKIKISVKEDARKAVEVILVANAQYINYNSAGQKTILLSSGYSVTSDSKNGKALGTPGNFIVTHGANSGEMEMAVTIPNCTYFVFQWALSPVQNDAWSSIFTNSNECMATGLKPMTMYEFRVVGASNKEQVVFSGVITKPAA